MDLFPFKLDGKGINWFGVALLSLVSIAINAVIWFAFAFLIAYAASKGWAAA